MTLDVFESQRKFMIWAYSVSHSRLLLRSTMGSDHPTRIDLYFGRVARMLLRPVYQGLRAGVADTPDTEKYRDRYGEIPAGYTLYTLEPDLASFVVAGVMQSHEDTGGFQEKSYFGRFDA